MNQYARPLAVDRGGNPFNNATPPAVANQSWSGSFTVSSTIGISDLTTVIQIATTGSAVNFKWGPGSVTGTSFDGTVPANAAQVYVIPVSILANANSVMGINGQNGLYNQISLKAVGAGTSSVFGCEF